MKKFGLIIMILFVFGCIVKYPNDYNTLKLNEIKETLLTITTEYDLTDNKGQTKKGSIESVAIPIDKDHILALSHATSHSGIERIKTPFGYIPIPVDVTNYKFSLGNEEVALVGRIDDISVFKRLKGSVGTTNTFLWGDSSKLENGTKLLMVGNSFMLGKNIKDGIVSKVDLNKKYYVDKSYKEEHKTLILITVSINTGDSGSPIFVIQNNKYYVVGIVYAVYKGNQMGLMFKSNYVQKKINEILRDKHQGEEL